MLSFLRKKNESIVINNDIVVGVLELRQEAAKLGVLVPRNASVHPWEVYETIAAARFPGKLDWQAILERFATSTQEVPSLEALDRLARKLTAESKRYVSREMVFQAILEAVAALEEQLSGATSLEHLKQLLLRRRY